MAGDHSFNMVTFDNVRVPKKNLVGEQNRGWYVGATLLDFERSGVDYSAGSRKMLEDLVEYSKNNYKNGRLLSEDPITRNRLANLLIEIDVSRLISYKVAWMQGAGLVPNKESSMGKVFGTELQQHVSAVGMQMLGMHSQLASGSKYAPLQGRVQHWHLSNVSETIAAGTSEIQRNIIASRGLGLPRG
jgi:alkylation response protein AidB-like acyl-CoA dehydrogenase